MKQLWVTILFILFSISIIHAQIHDPRSSNNISTINHQASFSENTENVEFSDPYIGIGVEVGINAGIGLNLGLAKLGAEKYRLSHGGMSILFQIPISTWGAKEYTTISQSQFREDVQSTDDRYTTISGIVGLKIFNELHILASLDYKLAYLVENRRDRTGILGNNGKYYTEYRIKDDDQFGIGTGLRYYFSINRISALSMDVRVSTARFISISVGYGLGAPIF